MSAPHLTESPTLAGQLLVATPAMGDPRFEKAVIYICAHSDEGAMGLMLNRIAEKELFGEVLRQLEIVASEEMNALPVYYGGPVESGRGFVLHSTDYRQDSTIDVNNNVANVTATLDILSDIAAGRGPRQALLALGYAGWSAGQLDEELQTNGWLVTPADEALLFETTAENRWKTALKKIGVEPQLLSSQTGHA